MPLFGHHRDGQQAAAPGPRPGQVVPGETVPGLADVAIRQGWRPLTGQPFDGHLEDKIHEVTRAMYGDPRSMSAVTQVHIAVGETFCKDAYAGPVNGHEVRIANSWTPIAGDVYPRPPGYQPHQHGVGVCAVELPTILPLSAVQPRRYPAFQRLRPVLTGNPVFDQSFLVQGFLPTPAGAGGPEQVLVPQIQQLIMARDDWFFVAERYWLGCIRQGAFGDVDEVGQLINAVVAIVAAIPASVMPVAVDHSADDLVARISQVSSLEDAMSLLQSLTPEDRARLARSDSPLAVMADVRSPQEAMARFKSLPPPQKMQLMAMFMRVQDNGRRR
jgi:hypothetical protein